MRWKRKNLLYKNKSFSCCLIFLAFFRVMSKTHNSKLLLRVSVHLPRQTIQQLYQNKISTAMVCYNSQLWCRQIVWILWWCRWRNVFDDSTFNSVKFISLVILSKMSNLDFQIKIIFWQENTFFNYICKFVCEEAHLADDCELPP